MGRKNAGGLFAALTILALLLAGCGAPTATPIPPTMTLIQATSTIVPTATFYVIPSETPTLSPTPSLTLTPSATPTATITPTPAPNAQVAPGRTGLRLRAQPGDSAEILAMLDEYTSLTVIGRSGDNAWLQVITPDNLNGWVMSAFVELRVDAALLPITDGSAPQVAVLPSPTTAPAEVGSLPTGAQVIAGRGGLRLRSLPSDNGMVLANLDEFLPLIIVGRTADNLWLRVITPARQTGWVWASYIDYTVDLNTVPIADASTSGIPAGVNVSFPPTAIPTTPPPPTVTPTPTPPTPPADVIAAGGNAQVAADGLRLRQEPFTYSPVRTGLAVRSILTVIGRTVDEGWLEVETTNGVSGWVMASFVDLYVDLRAVPITAEESSPLITPTAIVVVNNPQATSAPAVSMPSGPLPVVSGVSSHAREIFLNGQELGNHPDVFSKVGDSITVASFFLHPFGWGSVNLGAYGDLGPALSYFSGGVARDGSSPFRNSSLAAGNGWSTQDVLDPSFADHGICLPGETPLECEYRVVQPAVALIMLGTNDSGGMPSADFRANLSRIVEISIEHGVIPVLSTLPPRLDVGARIDEFNGIIVVTARSYDVPLWNYGGAVRGLPDQGLSPDGVHPSAPPGGDAQVVNFTPENLNYGFTVRNLTALQMLDALYRQVLY